MSGPLRADWYIFIYFAPLWHCVSLVRAPFTRICAWKVLNIADSSRKSPGTKADWRRQANKTKFMTKMANRINKYQSLRLTIWKIASNIWFTAALAILLRPVKTVAKFQWKRKNILKKTLYKITLRAILIFILVLSEENNADYLLFQKSNLEMEVMQLWLYRRVMMVLPFFWGRKWRRGYVTSGSGCGVLYSAADQISGNCHVIYGKARICHPRKIVTYRARITTFFRFLPFFDTCTQSLPYPPSFIWTSLQ